MKVFTTLTLILTNQKEESFEDSDQNLGSNDGLSFCSLPQSVKGATRNSEQGSAKTPLLLKKRINKGQSRISSDSIARESQHRSAGRENSGRFDLDAIIMDRPSKTKREGDRCRARGDLAALNELDVKA